MSVSISSLTYSRPYCGGLDTILPLPPFLFDTILLTKQHVIQLYAFSPARKNGLLSSREESPDNLLILFLPPPRERPDPFYCPLSHSLPFITNLWTIKLRKDSINIWVTSVPVYSSTDCLHSVPIQSLENIRFILCYNLLVTK